MKSTSFRRAIVPGIAVLSLALAACGGDDAAGAGDGEGGGGASGSVTIDGSSTVYPMTQAARSCWPRRTRTSRPRSARPAPVAGSSASAPARPTSPTPRVRSRTTRIAVCEENGVEYTELQVATDALTVVVHPDLAVDCLTTDQLIELWAPGSKINNWNHLDPSFPDQEISLFGPGTDSGTYDYMAADVIGDESETTRDDYEASEDDNVLVQGVSGTEGATGYFGYTYYEENTDTLKALAIDDGNGCVEPVGRDRSGRRVHPAVPTAVHLREQRQVQRQRGDRRSSPTSTSRTSRQSPRQRCSSRSTRSTTPRPSRPSKASRADQEHRHLT